MEISSCLKQMHLQDEWVKKVEAVAPRPPLQKNARQFQQRML
jgi:hypothetical protein